MSIKFTTFNVENLFSRPKAMNLSNKKLGTDKLQTIALLQKELAKKEYDKAKIVELANKVHGYFKINKTRGKNPLSWSRQNKTFSVKVSSKSEWGGFIELIRDRFEFQAVKNTGKFLRSIDADIVALCEVEGSAALRQFRSDQLSTQKLKYDLIIDGNDPRGIDVAYLSRLPFENIRTNIHAKRTPSSKKKLFSRDCLEAEFMLPSGESLWILQNHLLSKLRASNDERRGHQAQGIADILSTKFDLKTDLVIVSGDLNDDIENAPMAPLANTPDLHNALDAVGIPKGDQWTYYYGRENEKNRIDYILVSTPLKNRLVTGGVDRRGMAGISRLTNGQVSSIPGITNWQNAASDHAAVWIEFN